MKESSGAQNREDSRETVTVRFVAYIDESGDPGLKSVKPNSETGASEWLVLGCVLVRIENDRQTLPWVREILSNFKNRQTPYLHFTDLNPAKRAVACSLLASKPCRVFVAMSNKQNIENYENPNLRDQRRHWYYWWMTRLLLERVTDFCQCQTPEAERGGSKLRVVFSRRGRLRYADLEEYLTKIYLQSRTGMLYLDGGDLCWSVIDFEEILVLDHKARAGLQLADLVAGAFFQAVERDRPGECDPQYAKLFRPVVAMNRHRRTLGYGIKAMPELHQMNLVPSQREIFEWYGYNPEGWDGR
jgi:hypothetical protein